MQKKLLLFSIFVFAITSIYAATSVATKSKSSRSNYPRNSHHVVGGGGFAVELRNGEIWTWGSNTYGQLGIGNNLQQESPIREFTTAINWSDINPGQSHVLAVKADGTLWAWGRNNFGQLGLGDTTNRNIPQQIGSDNDWVTTGCGGNQSFAIKSNGTLWGWGNNSSGQLGIGTNSNSPLTDIPTQIGNATNWTDVAAGSNFTIALNSSGQMFTWGNDAFGQLGNGAGTDVYSPTQIQQVSRWLTIEAGSSYAMAIKSDGTLWSWGRNNNGQLGIGNQINQQNPALVASATPWIGISCGQAGATDFNQHSLGLKANGIAWSWGDNSLGALGTQPPSIVTTPQIITSESNIVAVECGWGVSYIRNASGQVYAAGSDTTGAIGNASIMSTNIFINTSVIPIGWSSFAAGEFYTVAIKSNGTLWMWGSNTNGQLGNGSIIPAQLTIATQIGTATNWKTVSAGTNHILAINASGQLYAWGSNSSGQIGNGISGGIVSTPVLIGSSTPWISISAGNLFSLGIKADGTLWSWGINSGGQLGQGNLTPNLIPVQVESDNKWVDVNAGFGSSAANKADGTLWMWGENNFGQLGKNNNSAGSQNYSPVQVPGGDWTCVGHTSGSRHVVALKSNGTLWSWGNNGAGALGKGTNTITSADYAPVQIGNEQTWVLCTAGYNHSAAIKVDGSPWTWGDNTYGQLGLGYFGNSPAVYAPAQVFTVRNQDLLDIVIDITCGWNHTAVIKDYRERICITGRNTNGQIGDGTFGTGNDRNEFQCLVYAPPCLAPSIPSLNKYPNNNVCPGAFTTLSIGSGNLNSATEWRWYADTCGTNYVGTGNSIVVNPSSTRTYFARGESGGCATPGSCASIVANVNPAVVPAVSISTATTSVCAGVSTTFTATPTNGGASPSYQWKVNGSNVGTSSATYTTSGLTNGQAVTCVLTSNANCVSPSTATSNSLTMTVNTCSSVPTTKLRTADCGKLNFGTNATVIADAVVGATNYDYEFTNLTTSSVTVKTSTTSFVAFSSVSPAIQYDTQYNVRVRAKVGGVYGNYGSVCLIGTICNPAICGVPSTQIRTVDCGKLIYSLVSGQIIADAVAGSTQFEFEFRNVSTNALVASKLQTLNTLVFNTVTPALQWGTQYNVRVRAYIGTVAGTYGSSCTIGFIPDPSITGVPNTKLTTAFCGKTNLALTGSISCDLVIGGSNYEWEFKNQANTTVIATKTTTSTSLNLSTVTGLNWNTQYNVRVRAYIGAVVGNYNISCLIGLIPDPALNGVPDTKLRTNDCGKLNFGLSGFIVADAISGAAEYEFEFRNPGTNALIATRAQTLNTLYFTNVPALQWNTQYSVKVRARIASTWGNFATACTIGFICNPAICGVPNTKVRTSECGKLNINLSTGSIIADGVAGAVNYEFEFTNLTTSTIVTTQVRASSQIIFNSIVPHLLSTVQYGVRVRANISGVWGNFGTSCTIGFVSGSREGQEMENAEETIETSTVFNAYPNPFNEQINININTNQNVSYNIRITDITGKMVSIEQLNTTAGNNIKTIDLTGLAKGLYFVQFITGDTTVKSIKLIKE